MKLKTIIASIMLAAIGATAQTLPLSSLTNIYMGTETPNSGTAESAFIAFNKINTNTVILSNNIAAAQSQISSLNTSVSLSTSLASVTNRVLWINNYKQSLQNPSLTNNQPVSMSDFSGLNQNIALLTPSSPVIWSSAGAYGRPGFLFTNAQILVITNLFNGCSSAAIEFTYLDYGETNGEPNYLAVCSEPGVNYPYSWRISPWLDAQYYTGGVTAGTLAFWTYVANGLTTSAGVINHWSPPQINTFIMNTDGSNLWCYFNGVKSEDTTIQGNNVNGLYGWMTNMNTLYIGSQTPGNGGFFNGLLLDCQAFSSMLTPLQLNNLIDTTETADGHSLDQIGIGGDSISVGLHATVAGGGLSQFIGQAYPSYMVDSFGYSGRTLEQEYTNIVQWLARSPKGKKLFTTYIGVNDFNGLSGPAQVTEVPVAISWVTNSMNLLTANGVAWSWNTLMDFQADTNSQVTSGIDTRSNYNALVRFWAPICGGQVMDYAANPVIGTNGAYKTSQFVDGLHPSSIGYSNMWFGTAQAGMFQLTKGIPSIFTNTTVNIPAGSAYLYNNNNFAYMLTNVNQNQYAAYLDGAGFGIPGNASIRSIGIGQGALAAETNGNANIAIGPGAEGNLLGGTGNIAIGWLALNGAVSNALTGDVAIGFESQLSPNTDTAGGTVSVGPGALQNLSNGHGDVAIGNAAGSSLTSGGYNIYIGNGVGGGSSENGNIYIGNTAVPGQALISGTVSPSVDFGTTNGGKGISAEWVVQTNSTGPHGINFFITNGIIVSVTTY
jgi:hypothetical protein